MKKINLILVVIFLTLNCSINAQVPVLMGMTSTGGINSNGNIFKINGDSTGFQSLYEFQLATGIKPNGTLFKANNGLYYGTAKSGGVDSLGVIFCYNVNTNSYSDIIDLNGPNGRTPGSFSNFMQSANGKLYCTMGGGDSSHGVISCLDPSNNAYTIVHSFFASTFYGPLSPLLQLNNGLIYGSCPLGGSLHQGGIYSFDLIGNIYTQINNSINTTGNAMRGYLVNYNDTLLYGCGGGGGLHGNGVIFSYNLITNTYTDLFDFTTLINGSGPNSGLMKANNGILYGMTDGGPNQYGLIFSFNPATNVQTVLHYFNLIDGNRGFGGLIQASDGKLYGMTQSGGTNGSGVVFSYDIVTNTYTVIHNFNGTDGNSPFGNLIEITETSTGVSGLSKENGVRIFPNPTTNTVTFHQDNYSPNQQVIITDVLGNRVYSQALYNATETIDISHLSSGIYFYEVSGKRGKIIKN
ncbi:MAG: T9SS type A sorting domain-containing protein [Bacteroidota bacterium]